MALSLNTTHALAALSNSIREMCGYILHDGTVIVMPNISASPLDSFEVNAVSQAAVLSNMHGNVMGMFHTHPRGMCWPSKKDVENWPPAVLQSDIRYFIATTREVGEFRLDEDGKPKPV